MDQQKQGRSEEDAAKAGGEQDRRPGAPEWVTFAVSILIVLSVLGSLVWFGFRDATESGGDGVPMAEARIDWPKITRRGERWLLPVIVENVGEAPLEEVAVVVEETLPSGEKQETDIAITFLSEKAEETVYVIADARPDPKRVRARVATLRTRHDARGY
ncbi:MAG TPA: hypothetical protein VM490_00625 [Armatimonadaceae bacterium]|nr:hypothetical protein [Armatimonadaceae bacterium]